MDQPRRSRFQVTELEYWDPAARTFTLDCAGRGLPLADGPGQLLGLHRRGADRHAAGGRVQRRAGAPGSGRPAPFGARWPMTSPGATGPVARLTHPNRPRHTQPLRRRVGDERGFTLVEVLLTVAIVGVVLLPALRLPAHHPPARQRHRHPGRHRRVRPGEPVPRPRPRVLDRRDREGLRGGEQRPQQLPDRRRHRRVVRPARVDSLVADPDQRARRDRLPRRDHRRRHPFARTPAAAPTRRCASVAPTTTLLAEDLTDGPRPRRRRRRPRGAQHAVACRERPGKNRR